MFERSVTVSVLGTPGHGRCCPIVASSQPATCNTGSAPRASTGVAAMLTSPSAARVAFAAARGPAAFRTSTSTRYSARGSVSLSTMMSSEPSDAFHAAVGAKTVAARVSFSSTLASHAVTPLPAACIAAAAAPCNAVTFARRATWLPSTVPASRAPVRPVTRTRVPAGKATLVAKPTPSVLLLHSCTTSPAPFSLEATSAARHVRALWLPALQVAGWDEATMSAARHVRALCATEECDNVAVRKPATSSGALSPASMPCTLASMMPSEIFPGPSVPAATPPAVVSHS